MANANSVPPGWVLKKALFHVSPSTILDQHKLDLEARDSIGKWVARMGKDGWTLESRPRVRELPFPSGQYKEHIKNGVGFVIPKGDGYPADHPLRKPGMVDLEILAYFSHPQEKLRAWIPDEYIEKHGLPSGFELRE